MVDRFGKLPDEVRNLLDVVAIKQLCRAAGVERVEAGPKGAVVGFRNNTFARPDKLIAFIARQSGTVRVRPDQRLVYPRPWDAPKQRIIGLRKIVSELAQLAA